MIARIFTTFCILFLGLFAKSQTLYRMNNIPVIHGSQALKNPFTGGMSGSIVNQMDLNKDGKKDLVIVQNGSYMGRIQTFIQKNGTTDALNSNYEYSPRYEAFFPKEDNFPFLLRDLNEDGLEDLIVMGNLYFILHYAKRDNDSSFHFEHYDTLKYYSYDTVLNDTFPQLISVLNKYLPIIRDIDGDGDMDMVYINRRFGNTDERWYYKNYKKELGKPANQNVWRSDHRYFGHFSFDTPITPLRFKENYYPNILRGEKQDDKSKTLTPRHDDFQMVWDIDVNSDGKMDVVAYSENQRNSPLGINVGTKDSTYIRHSDTYFPNYIPRKNHIMPIGFAIDVNQDTKNDILLSFIIERDITGSVSLEQRLFNDDIRTISFYKNVGKRTVLDAMTSTYHDSFVLVSDSFLSNETIDVGTGSQPIFFDYNIDSLPDLLIANNLKSDSWEVSTITYYQNIGNKIQPQYRLVTKDLFGYKSKNRASIRLASADINNDGKEDLLISSLNRITEGITNFGPSAVIDFEVYYQNGSSGVELFTKENVQIPYEEKYGESNICIYDINKDGNKDLIIGDKYNIKYYKNISNGGSLRFSTTICDSVINPLHLYDYPNAYLFFPSVWKDPKDAKDYLLFSYELYGGKIGKALIDTQLLNSNRSLNIVNKNVFPNYSLNKSPTIFTKDITNDGVAEFVIGNYSGGVQIFSFDSLTGIKDPPPPDLAIEETNKEKIDIQLYPNPTESIIHIELPVNYTSTSVQLFSMDGRLVISKSQLERFDSIDVSMISRGIYWLRLTDEKLGSYSKKIEKL